jgi:hypothetical protein
MDLMMAGAASSAQSCSSNATRGGLFSKRAPAGRGFHQRREIEVSVAAIAVGIFRDQHIAQTWP